MIVVSNTTPIISLSSIGKINLLKKIFYKIYVPTAVFNEIKAKKSYGYDDIDKDFFKIYNIKDNIKKFLLLNELDDGEAETIVLALEIKADFVLIDERIGYNLAKSLGLNPIGTLAILIEAKRRGFIEKLEPLLQEMVNRGRWYSEFVVEKVLKKVGER